MLDRGALKISLVVVNLGLQAMIRAVGCCVIQCLYLFRATRNRYKQKLTPARTPYAKRNAPMIDLPLTNRRFNKQSRMGIGLTSSAVKSMSNDSFWRVWTFPILFVADF
jgi:hypothetical protein